MPVSLRRCLPEALLIAVTLFFALRELGTFPAMWEDSGLYTLVARTLAEGGGYSLPILGRLWEYPYFLSVGPTVIVPVAGMIRVFGFSAEIARVVPVLYMLATVLCFHLYVRGIAGRRAALWSTTMLVTLSAFVNNGKPVLGSVPALFFLFLGLLLLRGDRTMRRALLAGVCFGLAMVTKLTFVLLLPALAAAFAFCVIRREHASAVAYAVAGSAALIVFVPWIVVELWHQDGFGVFLEDVFVRAQGSGSVAETIGHKIALLAEFPYAYFAVLLAAALVGLRNGHCRLRPEKRVFLTSLLLLFVLHFALREGWYRHLLPAHVLTIPFAVAGFEYLLGRRLTVAVLSFFILAQAAWQFDHRGSSPSRAAADAAQEIAARYADVPLLIRHPEIVVRLPAGPWQYYPQPGTEELIPARYTTLSPEQECYAVVGKLSAEDLVRLGERVEPFAGKYQYVRPPESCGPAAQ